MGPHSFECGNLNRPPHISFGTHSFNGAALVRVRKSRGILFRRTYDELASMGPHSFECGNTPTSLWCAWRSPPGFNGAALVRVRKCSSRSRLRYRAHGFNGAALVRVRKSGVDASWNLVVGLQWGRTRSSAEMPGRPAPGDRGCGASMGPHSFECGNFCTSALVLGDCFESLQWGRTRSSAEMSPKK